MKKILFVNDEMCMGGVARVLNTLMDYLDESKYKIDLLVLHPHGELMEQIPAKVNLIASHPFFSIVDQPFGQVIRSRNIKNIFHKIYLLILMKTGLIQSKIKKIRKKILVEDYDIEFAAKEGFCTVFVANGASKKKMNWVLVDYKQINYSQRHMRLLKESLKNIDQNIADSITAANSFKEVFDVVNVKAIPTLMDEKRVKSLIHDPVMENMNRDSLPKIITVGRFHPQKGMDRLIQSSIYTIEKGIKHELYLIGDGELRGELEALAKNYQHIHFLGMKKNPYNWIHNCDLFVLPSYYEGFATIVSESLIAGTPVLATEVAGIHEQITNEDYGRVVKNSQEDLNNGLKSLLENMEYLKNCKEILKTYQYPNEKILLEYEKEFD